MKYFVEVYEPLPPDQIIEEAGLKIDHHVTKSKGFWKLDKAWNWVLENNISKYVVYEAEEIIDNS